jgi:hypothetical protein
MLAFLCAGLIRTEKAVAKVMRIALRSWRQLEALLPVVFSYFPPRRDKLIVQLQSLPSDMASRDVTIGRFRPEARTVNLARSLSPGDILRVGSNYVKGVVIPENVHEMGDQKNVKIRNATANTTPQPPSTDSTFLHVGHGRAAVLYL